MTRTEKLHTLGGVVIPPGITSLGAGVVGELEELLETARGRDDHELEVALDHALRVIPAPLRGVARKVLGA